MSTFFHRQGDPRVRFADLVPLLPESNFEQWEQFGVCLCGCGEKTQPRHRESNSYEVSYWKIGHAQALRRQHGLMPKARRSKARTAAQVRENMSRTIDGRAILDMVRQHIDEHYGGSMTRFCRAHGLLHNSLSYNYRVNYRMTKGRAIKLLTAIGETVPGHLRH